MRGKKEKREKDRDRETVKRGKVDSRCQSEVIREEVNEFPLHTKKRQTS